jgi:hypothetical protein
MKPICLTILLAGSAGLAACATYPAAGPIPVASNNVCGSYGYVDRNNDGMISGDEWNSYRSGAYTYWDVNHDGRIDRTEFENCWRGGGFYQQAYYNPNDWTNYYTGFDANHDGYLDANEYFSANAWTRADRNHNGIIDSNEWQWWM